MARALVCALLLFVGFFVIPSVSVLSKTIVGSCCNGDEGVYAAQESWAGRKLYVVGSYAEFCESSFYDWSFGVMLSDWNNGRITHLTLNAQTSNGCNNFVPADPNTYITSGGYDAEIGYFVTHCKTFLAGPDGVLGNSDDRRMYFRLEHEMNGDWYAWSNGPANYAAAWRYVWNKMMSGTGFTKSHIQWVFEPISPYEKDTAHDFRNYWPGDQYVDWLSLDGYNSAGSQPWYQPYEVFDVMLYKLRDFRPHLPVLISETGSYSGPGGGRVNDKNTWVSNLLPYLAKWNVQIVLYFNTNPGPDWPVVQPTSYGTLAARETISINGANYQVYDAWKTAWQTYGYTLTNPSSPRIMTDDEFQGRLPGYQTAPAQPTNLVIYSNGHTYFDWQCTPAPYALNLNSTVHVQSGATHSLQLDLSAWGNVQFHSAHLGANTSDYTGIQFKIFTSIANVVIHVIPFTSSGNLNAYTVTIPTASTWTSVSLSWAQLGVAKGILLQGFYVQGASNNDQGATWFDSVLLTAGPVNWY